MQPTDDLSTNQHIQPMDSRKQVFIKNTSILFSEYSMIIFRKK
jgi:hypothetical protein